MGNRIEAIDICKGVGICLVVLFHCSISSYSHLTDVVCTFHMPLFFFLAGICFSTRYTFDAFAKRKIKRLMIPYFFFAIIHIALMCCLYGGNAYNNVILKLPMHLPSTMWFLLVLFLSELICFPIILKVSNRKARVVMLAISGIIGAYVCSVDRHIPQALGSVPLASFYLLLGHEGKQIVAKANNLNISAIVLVFFLCIITTKIVHAKVYLYMSLSSPMIISEVIAIMGIIVCLGLSYRLVGTKWGGY